MAGFSVRKSTGLDSGAGPGLCMFGVCVCVNLPPFLTYLFVDGDALDGNYYIIIILLLIYY